MQGLALGCLERRLNRALQIADERALYILTSEPVSQYRQLVCRELSVMRTCFDVLVGGCTEQEMFSFLSNTTARYHNALESICAMVERPDDFSWMLSCESRFNNLIDLCFDACKKIPECSECTFGVHCTVTAFPAMCGGSGDSYTPEITALLQAKMKVSSLCYPDKAILEIYPNIMNELRQRQAEMLSFPNVTEGTLRSAIASSAPRVLEKLWSRAVTEAAAAVLFSFGWAGLPFGL